MIKLGENSYGKNAVQLSKIIRHPEYDEFRQITVNVSLQGDFETAHTRGDNTKILPTDTQKNTVYALAKEHFTTSIEAFALHLAEHFVHTQQQVSTATVEIAEAAWSRLTPHAYISGGTEKHTTRIVYNAAVTTIASGITDLLILKTTDSGFEHFIKDPYTTLKETSDRILATQCEATWIYKGPLKDYSAIFDNIRATLLGTFAGHNSLSVQQTLYAMGEAVLEAYPEVQEITLKMPNKHHILFNLEQFGMSNQNEIFIATDEPYGYIVGTVIRE
ncbi:factor-independent urate hydroxylase [Chitinophaga sp.]|uniref:factor-independent urate hydroxylase n=1 Tax=Chitinophaga sp. TaxID=1869181 RepID=UPI0031DED111